MTSSRVRLIMMVAAISFIAGIFGVFALNSSLHQDPQDQNLRNHVPALGPTSARPQALNLRWKSNEKWKSVNELKGKVIYLSFWASWCAPCQHEMPIIDEVHKSYRKAGLETLMINMDDSEQGLKQAQQMIQNFAPSVDHLFQGEQNLKEFFNLQALPYHLIIDKNGKTAAAFYARVDRQRKEFESLIQSLLEE